MNTTGMNDSNSDPGNPYRANEPLFMAHMIAGYPSMAESEKVAVALAAGGSDIIELQIPFSDPMADGPTIAVASEDALKAGASVATSLTLLKKVAVLGKPVAVMSYTNPVFQYGIPEFVKTIAGAGASPAGGRSEERRVGKECRSRWSPH